LGLALGEHDFFHLREIDDNGDRRVVFSVANMLKPGTFERAALAGLTTRGLTLFMQIPGPLTASEAFDLMAEKAGSIAVRLGGTVCDEQRAPLNAQRTREIRERLLSYDFTRATQRDTAAHAAPPRPY
jgi:cell division protein ZipA